MAEVKNLSHVGLAVESIDQAVAALNEVLGAQLVSKEVIEDQKIVSATVSIGAGKFEIMEPTDESSAVAKHIKAKGVGIQHISVEVDNLKEYCEGLEAKGIKVLGAVYDGPIKYAFIHPKHLFGLLVEVTEP